MSLDVELEATGSLGRRGVAYRVVFVSVIGSSCRLVIGVSVIRSPECSVSGLRGSDRGGPSGFRGVGVMGRQGVCWSLGCHCVGVIRVWGG